MFLRLSSAALLATILLMTHGCSIRHLAADSIGDTLAASGIVFAGENDPDLARDASAFALKFMESVLAERPNHTALLTAASRSFTQYAYAFVQQPADELEDRDVAAAYAQRARASRFYRRARDYGLRALDVAHPRFVESLRADPVQTLMRTEAADVPRLYWSGLAWAALIALSKDDPEEVADLPLVEALMERALLLDEGFDSGAIHTFLISFEAARIDQSGDPPARARAHFERAVTLSGGRQAAPFVAMAEAVSVPAQKRGEFERLLQQAVSIDIDAAPEWRLANLINQRRARWLLARADQLFLE